MSGVGREVPGSPCYIHSICAVKTAHLKRHEVHATLAFTTRAGGDPPPGGGVNPPLRLGRYGAPRQT